MPQYDTADNRIAVLSTLYLALDQCIPGRFQVYAEGVLQRAPGLTSYKLGQKTIIFEHYAQIVQAPIYIVHDMTLGLIY
ncbi:hypothetical protein VN97_g11743 [Penicillium thymicola]|uniref:Uncharacterized protein n=1 Tax=Penicillium thymicola TaxID=293382 RepID=A0AAI9X2Y0_PENTH|nr:hypothetical protein VN97_g11743 [Penicillium thymicola]